MITKFSRTFVENMVKAKVATDKNILRNYDILKDKERGLSYSQLSIKYSLCRDQIIEIVKKYRDSPKA